jgi:hypothetical protein
MQQENLALNNDVFKEEPDFNILHLNTMPFEKHALKQVQAEITSLIYTYYQNRINKICPNWIESIQYFERPGKLLVSIKLAKRPDRGEIPAFQNRFITLAGTAVEFTYSAGKSLQDERVKVSEPIQKKSDLTEKINNSLPENMQLTKLWIYNPKVADKTHTILLCQIMSDERQDSALRAWQEKFEEENDIDILIKRDWVKPALERMLSQVYRS